MSTEPNKVSDEAVQRATGKTWSEWERTLDAEEAWRLSHKEIVTLLRDGGHIQSEWWMQQVTVGYEKMKGLRVPGHTKDTGFQIGARRTLPISHDAAWRLVTSPEGIRTWLGDGTGMDLAKGAKYRLSDGSTGEVRVINPKKHLRITYHPESWPRPSTIQVRTEPKGEKAVISFHEEHLPNEQAREDRRSHFKAALDALADLLD